VGCEFLGRVAHEFLGIVSTSLLEGVGSGREHRHAIDSWNCL
jgi:hypothetical protein